MAQLSLEENAQGLLPWQRACRLLCSYTGSESRLENMQQTPYLHTWQPNSLSPIA